MTHGHEPHSHERRVVERDRSASAGLLIAVIAIVVLAMIAFGVFWVQPWDSESGGGTNITIDAGGGGDAEGGTDGENGGGDGGNGGGGEAEGGE